MNLKDFMPVRLEIKLKIATKKNQFFWVLGATSSTPAMDLDIFFSRSWFYFYCSSFKGYFKNYSLK